MWQYEVVPMKRKDDDEFQECSNCAFYKESGRDTGNCLRYPPTPLQPRCRCTKRASSQACARRGGVASTRTLKLKTNKAIPRRITSEH